MAQPIQDPTVGGALQALFGLQGRVRPALEEFIIPTVRVADLSQGAAPGIRRRVACAIVQAAVAGEYFTARLEMIPGSIAVVRFVGMYPTSGTAGNLKMRFPGNAATIGALANTATKSYVDGRILAGSPGGQQNPAGVLTYATSAAAFAGVEARYPVPGTGLLLEDPGWVVGTGRADLYGFLEMQFSAVNEQVTGTVVWDEYQIL